MPEKETIERAREDAREGKAPSTQAGEFVREEMHHIREGKHGARSTKQAIAIGLSKARRAGVKLRPPRKGAVQRRRVGAQPAPIARAKKAERLHPSGQGPAPKLCAVNLAVPHRTGPCPARRRRSHAGEVQKRARWPQEKPREPAPRSAGSAVEALRSCTIPFVPPAAPASGLSRLDSFEILGL